MARKQHHEEHANHEAWAIPYGDLITLLLALFVVMYAVSSINEGKYRVLSDAMSAAFGGPPKSLKPIQVGRKESEGAGGTAAISVSQSQQPQAPSKGGPNSRRIQVIPGPIQTMLPSQQVDAGAQAGNSQDQAALQSMAKEIEQALSTLIEQDLVIVRKSAMWLEVEIKTDILFASGSAEVSAAALPTLARLAEILRPFPHSVRIEGYTDNVPIRTYQFPSNWELAGARAAGVVRVFVDGQMDPRRLSVLGYGEYRPAADNASTEGRNRNRRVVIVVLADPNAARELAGPATPAGAGEPTAAREAVELAAPAAATAHPAP